MTLNDPRWLWLLLALVPLLLLEWRAAHRSEKGVEALVGKRRAHALLAQRLVGQRRWGALLRLAAFSLLVVGAAGPEWGREVVRRGATGSDVVFVVDISASMDARDVPPSRLAEARREALAVLDRLEGSRVGVVAFAGDAVRMCPLTLERSAVRLTLESLSTGSVSEPGTDLGKALRMAHRVMPQGRREEQVIVIWTDGEDLEQSAEAAIDDLAAAGVRVFAVGVGTPAGDVVPILDAQGRAIDVKRDASGGPVRSRLDQTILQTLARKTHGGYFAADQPGGELPRLLSALGTVSRSARGERLVERPVARFTLLAGLAFLLLLFERSRARRRLLEAPEESGLPSVVARGAGAAAVLLIGLVLPGVVHAQSAWARGDAAFRKGRYAEAESLYAKRLEKGGPDAVRVNLATARALAGSEEGVEQTLTQLATADDESGRAAGYNLGTHLGEANEIDRALEELRRSLVRDPADEDARWNYEVLLQRQRQQDQEQTPQSEQQNDQQEREQEQEQSGSSGETPPQQPQGGSQQQQSTPPQPSPGTPREGLDRAQAERLLGALEELQRLERQRQRRVRMVQEKPGKDW